MLIVGVPLGMLTYIQAYNYIYIYIYIILDIYIYVYIYISEAVSVYVCIVYTFRHLDTVVLNTCICISLTGRIHAIQYNTCIHILQYGKVYTYLPGPSPDPCEERVLRLWAGAAS